MYGSWVIQSHAGQGSRPRRLANPTTPASRCHNWVVGSQGIDMVPATPQNSGQHNAEPPKVIDMNPGGNDIVGSGLMASHSPFWCGQISCRGSFGAPTITQMFWKRNWSALIGGGVNVSTPLQVRRLHCRSQYPDPWLFLTGRSTLVKCGPWALPGHSKRCSGEARCPGTLRL